MNNVVLVPDVQQSDSVTHIHVSNCLQIILLFRLLQSIEQFPALCSRSLFILYIAVCTCESHAP